MKKKLLVLFAALVLCPFITIPVSAQDKNIRLVKGKQLVLKGKSDGPAEHSYFFRAKKGQNITIRLIGKNVIFVLYARRDSDPEMISDEVTYWTDKLPWADAGEYEIRVNVYHVEVKNYTLKITLK